MNTASVIRHLLTYLAGLGGLLLSWHLIAADQVEEVNKAASELMAPAAVILGAVAVTVGRILIAWVQTLFRRGAGETGNGIGSGAGMLLVWVGTTVGLCLGLPSCSADSREALKNVPIRACYLGPNGERICYSSKSGIELSVDRNSGK